MKFRNYIFIFFILISSISFSQPSFSNIDSLFIKNIRALNLRDSTYYLSLLNQSIIFKGKVVKTKADSLVVLEPFKSAFRNTIESFKEMVLDSDFTVSYSNYESVKKNSDVSQLNGKILFRVNLILNDSFIVKMPFEIIANNGTYSVATPMMVMFVDGE